jgi:hypothetical protein
VIYISDLEPHCASWIVSRKDGTLIGEFFDRRIVERFNPETCTVETAAQYLARINREIRKDKGFNDPNKD